MTAHLSRDHAGTPGTRCWCCGADRPEEELVNLGDHPEVGICPRCALWLHRRATELADAQHPTIAGRLRTGVRTVRTAVIRKGWHERGHLGALLRRIDRYLP
jgi:hypothetical protein